MGSSAIQYTDSDSMLKISNNYKLTCEYDGNKPDQIEIPELNLVLKKNNWLVSINADFFVCDSQTRDTLFGDIQSYVDVSDLKKRFTKSSEIGDVIHLAVLEVIKREQKQGGLLR